MTQGERRERLTERPLRVFEAATSFAVGPVGSGELAPEVCALDRCVPALLPQPPMNVPRPRQCQPAHLGDRLKQQLHLYLIALAEADKRMSASPLPSSARKEGRSPRLSMTRCLHRARTRVRTTQPLTGAPLRLRTFSMPGARCRLRGAGLTQLASQYRAKLSTNRSIVSRA